MRIAADGTWFYCGSPIGRAPLVQLFASVMRREGERYVLVTPVEKVGIKVDDAPFLAVEMRVESASDGPRLTFRTNVEDMVTVDSEHPLRFERGASEGTEALREGARRPVGAGQARAVLRPCGPRPNGAGRGRGLVWRALARPFLPHVPSERNRGALSANLAPVPSSASAAHARAAKTQALAELCGA